MVLIKSASDYNEDWIHVCIICAFHVGILECPVVNTLLLFCWTSVHRALHSNDADGP